MNVRDRMNRTPALIVSAGVVLSLALLGTATAAAQQEKTPEDFRIAVDVSQVVLDVTVHDKRGRLVPGLGSKDFRVLEDGVEQAIVHLGQEDRPLTLSLVVDSSRSIGERRSEVIEGATRVANLSHDQDDIFLVAFNDAPRLGLKPGVRFAPSVPALRDALLAMMPEGRTALYDAVNMAISELGRGKWEREAAVVFSDGGDTASNATLEEALEQVRRSNALVYTIGLASINNPYRSPKILRRLAEASGGEAYFPQTREELKAACEAIATEMRSQYTLTYAPSNSRREGLYREIKVELVGPATKGWSVRAREGYYEAGAEKVSQR